MMPSPEVCIEWNKSGMKLPSAVLQDAAAIKIS